MSALKAKILDLIRAEGPITVSQYMLIALYDPQFGYYISRDPLGAPQALGGDFVTSPEISQVFGELIGLFFVQAWEDRGRPQRFHLVELGPGRGTMMADMLRATKVRPAFRNAAIVTLIETSPALREIQTRALANETIRWAERLEDIPSDAPLFVVGNEFLDAFPIHQFVKRERGWHERMVSAQNADLVFALTPETVPLHIIPAELRDGPIGSVYETAPAAQSIVRQVAMRVRDSNGAALFVDYGHAQTGYGDTFQALRAHRFSNPLTDPGEADLTAHVDFAALSKIATAAGAAVFGPATQGEFLLSLGARERASRLGIVETEAVNRLIGPENMGALFKVAALCAPQSPTLPGFTLPRS